jgi:hypothetical protein
MSLPRRFLLLLYGFRVSTPIAILVLTHGSTEEIKKLKKKKKKTKQHSRKKIYINK